MSWWKANERFGNPRAMKGRLVLPGTCSGVAKPKRYEWLPPRLTLRPDYPRGNIYLYAV